MNGYYSSPYGASQRHDQFFQYPQHVQYEQDVHSHSQQHRLSYQTRQQMQQQPYHGLSSSGTVNASAYAVRDSFMRSAAAAAAHSPVYQQHSQMMHLPQAGRYDRAFNGYADAQHTMYSAVEFAQYQHHPDNFTRDYRQAHVAHHALNMSVPGMIDEAQLYAQQATGLQSAFEPDDAAWQHPGHAHMRYANAPMHGEDFEAGWHAGHYSSPTHHLGQEMYAGAELADSFDYPTFLRPAELAGSYQHQEPTVPASAVADIASAGDEIQLIAPDASAIPAPLPIEKSAHPLAALATDLVWEAFLTAANHNSPASSSSSQFSNSSNELSPSSGRSKVGSSPATSRYSLRSSVSPAVDMHKRSSSKSTSPLVITWNRSRSASAGPDADNASSNVYGAIGGERKPRLSLESSPGSDSSSPASTAPGTPAMDAWMVTDAGHGGRLGGQGYWTEEDAMDIGKHSLPPISSLLRPAAAQRFGGVTAPYALYDQIQKLLSATLLSQQVLLLALYYVARIPHTSPLYPPATSQSALQSTSAPFKLLLAALVVANKHLDDNSFRNSTFSQVSKITLPEVNALEYSLLAGLNFDLNIDTPAWLAWLRDLETHQSTAFVVSQASSPLIISDIIRGVEIQRDQQAIANEQGKHAVSLSCDVMASPSQHGRTRKMSLFDMPLTPRSESSMSGCFDLDASGPIEQRPRYNKQVVLPPVSYATGQAFGACSGAASKFGGYKGDLDHPGRMMMA